MEPINNNTNSQVQSHSPPKAAQVSEKPRPAAPAASSPRFISPMGNIDAKNGTFTIQFRDTSTGEVKSEYPRKVAASEYSKVKAATHDGGHNVQVETKASAPDKSSPPAEESSSSDSSEHKVDVNA